MLPPLRDCTLAGMAMLVPGRSEELPPETLRTRQSQRLRRHHPGGFFRTCAEKLRVSNGCGDVEDERG